MKESCVLDSIFKKYIKHKLKHYFKYNNYFKVKWITGRQLEFEIKCNKERKQKVNNKQAFLLIFFSLFRKKVFQDN